VNAESWLLEQESPPRLVLALGDLAQVAHLADSDQVGSDDRRGVGGDVIDPYIDWRSGWRGRGRKNHNRRRLRLAAGKEKQDPDDTRSNRVI
jgi:hypothetical protein